MHAPAQKLGRHGLDYSHQDPDLFQIIMPQHPISYHKNAAAKHGVPIRVIIVPLPQSHMLQLASSTQRMEKLTAQRRIEKLILRRFKL